MSFHKFLLISAVIFFGVLGLAKISLAADPVAGRKKLSLSGFLFTLFVIFTSLFIALPAYGATINAASCSQTDVQTAINSASDGDTINIPAGNCTWSTTVNISGKALTLQGSGIGLTNITDGVSGDNPLLSVSASATNFVSVSGFTFTDSSTPKSGGIIIFVGTFGQVAFRYHHNYLKLINTTGSTRGLVVGGIYGLIDNSTFYNRVAVSTHDVEVHGSYADAGFTSWKTPQSWGTNQAIYIEDCVFDHSGLNDGALDGYNGARFVFRHNTVTNTMVEWHGTDSGDSRSVQTWEIYNNTFNGGFSYLHYRGGTGVVYSNTFIGTWAGIGLWSYRSCPRPGQDTMNWKPADGTQLLHCAKANVANCTTDADCNLWGGNYGPCTLKWCSASKDTECSTNGDCPGGETCSYYFDGSGTSGYPVRDQIGRTTNQALDPAYFWDNGSVSVISVNGPADTCTPANNVSANIIVPNRDYYVGVPKPGYMPYTYPHPLRAEAASDTTPPAAPSGVTVI